MTKTIEIKAEIDLDEYHAGMLKDLEEEHGKEQVKDDIQMVAVDQDAVLTAIYQSHRQLQNGQLE